MKKIVMEGLHCANCSKRVEKALAKIGGKKLVVSHVDGTAQGEFKPTVTNDAIKEAIKLAKPSDVVLLLGKGHEKSILRADGPHDFEDIKVARSALHSLGYKYKN